jgi:hypothetical protein
VRRFYFVAGLVLFASSAVCQQSAMFEGLQSIQWQIAPSLSVYAAASNHNGKKAIRYDVSYEKWVSVKKSLFAVAVGVATNDASLTGNMVDEPRLMGKLYVTYGDVTFVPDVSNEDSGWAITRDQLVTKHMAENGEEVSSLDKKLHGVLHFQPISDLTGQLAWSNGLGAKVLEEKHPKAIAAAFLDYFHNTLMDPSTALERITGK